MAFWLIGMSFALQAQEFRFERFSVNDGLASSKVFDITQDSRGLIWVGTELGLCRYNGSAFKTYGVLDGLPGNSVIKVYNDPQDRLWLWLQAGIGYWQDSEFNPLRVPEQAQSPRINSAVASPEGQMFAGSGQSIWQFIDGQLQAFERVPKGFDLSGASLYYADDEQTLWYGTGNYLVRLKDSKLDTLLRNSSFVRRHYLLSDPQNKLYYISSERILLLNGNQAEPVFPALQHLLRSELDLSTAFIDPQGNWWIGSFAGGLYFFPADQLDQGQAIRYLDSEVITSIFQDRDDNLWVGTESAGLFLLSYRARQVRNIRGVESGLMDELFSRRIYSRDGVRWSLERNGQQQSLLAQHPSGAQREFQQLGNPYKLIRGPASTVLLTSSAGFFQFEWPQSAEPGAVEAGPYRLISGPARVAWYDSVLERTWLYTMGGLLSYQNGVVDTLVANTESRKLIISGMAGLPGQNRVWMSSYGMGLFLWQNDSLLRFGTERGLNSNSLVDAWLDESGELWVIGSNGVNKLSDMDYESLNFRVYSLYENDGLIIGEVRGGLESRDTIWLRTNAGLSFFPRDLITREPRTKPGIEITAVIIDNRDTTILPEYELAHFQNDLEIRFSGIAYSDSRRIRYRYRVSGLHDDWQETAFGELRLSKLRPATYTLELRSVDIYDMESPTTERIVFVIRPAIWQQRGYQVLAGLLILALSIGLVWLETRRRARHREAKLILEKQLAETEQMALRAQMNPHFIYNVLNSIQQFILRNDTESALDYLAEFGDLIRRSFENSKHMSIPLSDEIAFLNTYLMLEKMRFDEMLEYHIEVGSGVDIHHTFVPSLLIQPFVENSIRHGLRHKEGTGHIDIRFALQGDKLICTIDDDGVGIDQARAMEQWKSEEHRSSGMEITRSRLQVFNKMSPGKVGMEVFDRKTQGGVGTRVVLTIPVQEDSKKRLSDGESEDDPLRDRRRRAEGPGIPT